MELHLSQLGPEITLLVTAGLVLLIGLARRDALRQMTQVISLVGLGAAGIIAFSRHPSADVAYPELARYVSMLACGIGFLSILAAWDMPIKADASKIDRQYAGEFYAMMLFSLAGVSMVGKVNDLIWLFLVLELVSIPTYILVATGRNQAVAQESGVKYFFLGALAAAVYLFGFSYLYGFAGSTRFVDIAAAFQNNAGTMPYLALIGLLLVLIGVAYKIAAVPLHFYAADVYQGAATPVTAFLAFAPKAAGIISIILLLGLTNWTLGNRNHANVLGALLTVLAVLTMTIGNILALLQRNLKRMLAYSSVAHSGYMLVGLVAGPDLSGKTGALMNGDGVAATLFYLGAYSLMNLGVFAVLIYLQGNNESAEDIDDLAGLSKAHPLSAFVMMICLFSLIGMPGTIGFLGKFYLVQAALSTGHAKLAIVTVINAAIAAAYYLNVIRAMYLREAWTPFAVRQNAGAPWLAAAACTVLVIAFGLSPQKLLGGSQHAARSVRNKTAPASVVAQVEAPMAAAQAGR